MSFSEVEAGIIEAIVFKPAHPLVRERSEAQNRMMDCLCAVQEDRCGWALYHRGLSRPLTRGERRRKAVCQRCSVHEPGKEG